MKEEIKDVATVEFRTDNILVMTFAPKSNIDLEKAKKTVAAAEKLVDNKMHANLVDIRKMTFMASDARKYFGGQDKSIVAAVAILMNSKFQMAFVNMYVKFNRPIIPTKYFDDEEKAISFLKQKLAGQV